VVGDERKRVGEGRTVPVANDVRVAEKLGPFSRGVSWKWNDGTSVEYCRGGEETITDNRSPSNGQAVYGEGEVKRGR